jgi:hypothetical protein
MSELPAGFGKFWSLYWRRVKRAKAILAWVKLNPDPALTQVILDAVEAQRKEQLEREAQYRPHAATWLNGREWENELTAPKKSPAQPAPAVSPLAAYCDWHRDATHDSQPSRKPKDACPVCKHLRAKNSGRPGGLSPIEDLDDPLPEWAGGSSR